MFGFPEWKVRGFKDGVWMRERRYRMTDLSVFGLALFRLKYPRSCEGCSLCPMPAVHIVEVMTNVQPGRIYRACEEHEEYF